MMTTLGELLMKEHLKMRKVLDEALPPLEVPVKSRNNETTTLYSTILDLHLLSHYTETYSRKGKVVPRDIISIIRELIKNPRWAMLQYYIKHGAASVWLLRYSLNMSKPAAYRWHKLIEETGLVEIKTTISPIGKMKRPASIWGLSDATEAQVRDACQYHLKLTSPIYRKADKIAKKYLQEGKPATINIGELIRYLKEINEPPRMRYDLARMMRDIFSREAKAARALSPAELGHINRAENKYYEILLKEKEEEKGEIKYTVDEIKTEIKDYLDSKGTKEDTLTEIYLHFKSIFTDINDFRKACVELSREGYTIWQ